MLTKRFERLNALAEAISASKYLEIGINQGFTFTRINVPYKVAVDPQLRFDFHTYANKHTVFHEVTSDIFFSKFASIHGQFDLIFLDGLHTFDQTFRDFCASLKFSHSNTVWLIDDTFPSSLLAANPDSRITWWLRKLLKIKDR